MIGYVFLNLAIMLVLLGVLFYMNKKHISFTKRVFTGLGLGIVFGLLLQYFYEPQSEAIVKSVDWFNIVGSGYVKFLQMIVMPLVFISILSAFTRLKLTSNIGKISVLIIGILLGTTAIAAAVGITSATVFNLEAVQIEQGEAELSRGDQISETYGTIQDKTMPQQILELIPSNPFLDLTGARPTSTISVVIFAAFLGIAYLGVKRKQPEHAEFFAKIVDTLHSIIMRVVTLILRLTPYGILAIMTKTVATSDLDAILKLGKFVGASYVALIVMFLIHLLLLMLAGLNPIVYLRKAFPVLSFAFTSRTSAGALPLNIQTQKQLGVSEGIANFAGSFGLSIGQNGCAGIYPAMLAVMIAPTVGINPLDPSFIAMLIAIVAISSFGVAGVGGGATFAAILVLSAMNLPIALAGLLISVEPLIDMGRTAVNVSGSMTSGILTSKITGDLDKEQFSEESSLKIEAEM
ncbi:L-cystine transporter [Peribacillus castrilensis]|jgi:L-cystine uptake protein TcyP (sodium:dicarboxylate symporter family)|uniref:L-cystine uptake protein TcyP n=1 Tax=Peribacillus simplex TaxID=1478 RepID=A0AAN2PKS6_9BACI|nr:MULTISPECIES: L-cystine transporter [Bacillaceae]MBD8134499.1 L-cystine transporter [Bacillus sp. CFBP 13597]MDP9739509.1 L-cystine uptake protein TcyP (sodium:dicarboxylate symporter family) [Bacillus sp. B2I3]QNK48541.1 L-cystine transporter [Brevibacterium sp. PAMC23299]QYF84387.1 L-cystine transporter [Brevibacterium sp. PAMC21349]MBX9955292.1 L-cystine transporter [Peribacillus simplex]